MSASFPARVCSRRNNRQFFSSQRDHPRVFCSIGVLHQSEAKGRGRWEAILLYERISMVIQTGKEREWGVQSVQKALLFIWQNNISIARFQWYYTRNSYMIISSSFFDIGEKLCANRIGRKRNLGLFSAVCVYFSKVKKFLSVAFASKWFYLRRREAREAPLWRKNIIVFYCISWANCSSVERRAAVEEGEIHYTYCGFNECENAWATIATRACVRACVRQRNIR